MTDTPFHLSGLLNDFLLPDIVQLIVLGQKTGELRLRNSASQQAGSLFFERDILAHAVCGDETGLPALATIAGWKSASFSFLPDLRSAERSVNKQAMAVLLEALHRHDELAEVSQRLPGNDTRLFISLDVETPPQLSRRHWKALALVNGRRTVGAVCLSFGDQLEARKLLADLLATKLVTDQPPNTDWYRLVPKGKPAGEVNGQRGFPGRLRTNLLLKAINGNKSVFELRLELELEEKSVKDLAGKLKVELEEKVLWEELKYLIDEQWVSLPAQGLKQFLAMEQEL